MTLAPKRTSAPSSVESRVTVREASYWSTSLQTVLDQPPSPLPARLALSGAMFCLIFSAWAWFGQVDDVAKATGTLIPKDEVLKIYSFEAGKVVHVAVKAGQSVKAGQILVELDTDLAAKEVERLEKALYASQAESTQVQVLIDRTRLQAQAKAAIAQAVDRAQAVSLTHVQTSTESNRSLLAQLREDATAQQTRWNRLKLLVNEGAIPQNRLFEAEQGIRDRNRSITESTGTLQRSLAEANRLQAGLTEKQAEAQQSLLQAQQDIQQLTVRMTELQRKIAESRVLLEAAKAKLKKQFLYAPADGVVLTLNMRQQGEVVQPSQTIAEIVPEGTPLILSTTLPNQKADFVKTGMPVKVKLDAYPFQDYGMVPGKVMTISPDSKPDKGFGQIYRVDIELARTALNTKGLSTQFTPGQTVSAEIVTRKRRIADVLLDSIKNIQRNL